MSAGITDVELVYREACQAITLLQRATRVAAIEECVALVCGHYCHDPLNHRPTLIRSDGAVDAWGHESRDEVEWRRCVASELRDLLAKAKESAG